MPNLLKRLWLWYGTRKGYLDTSEGFTLSSATGNGHADTVTWRGEMVEGARTAMFRAYPSPSILVWNRVLSDAEIGLVREGWKRGVAPTFEGTHGAIMPTPPAIGKADFSTLLHQWIGPNPEDK